ncbi:hypothetical protein SDC9_07786 [bioreactor metagenome]|uniref:Uncharacterized protein n=1 Tax=bioreactor metagenome TaxID=1076179 RepID=A0A644T7K1_9ZZZZ|nr:hypothetical protein [Candidatus Elulimicrobiales bacterium]
MSRYVSSLPTIGSGYTIKGEALSNGFRFFVEDKEGKRGWTTIEVRSDSPKGMAEELAGAIQEILNTGRAQGHKYTRDQIMGEPFKNLSEN